jgi:tetratricopeptide (TPR) repeat protein
MTELRIEHLTMPGADLGPENPLPPLRSGRDLHVVREPVPGVSEEMQRNMVYGHVPNILPYTMQDGYNRRQEPRKFQVAILENEFLCATILLAYGGRLWSLVHKPSGRELLDRNPVFQPANLALRNAWFSGGVEWNIGTTGHSPFTCSPLFAARVETPEGIPVLRLYEWERIRQVPFQVDLYLPDDSPVLFVSVRITNPHSETVPMYWWSNIAVPETLRTRVLVPASSAYSFGYAGGGLAHVTIPKIDGVDISYPTHIARAADFFFHIDEGTRPWITALDETGTGLIQTSTPRLKGRKLFLWGMGEGGRRWQTFLAEPGHAYLEIQAGLARTQLEHLPMPAHTSWSWLEAYGLLVTDPEIVHGSDWARAVTVATEELEALIPTSELEAEMARCASWLDLVPAEIIQRGAGWGALERLRRESSGASPMCSDGLIFDEQALSPAEAPWVQLLKTGTFPDANPAAPPGGYLTQPEWRERLERAVQGEAANWFAWMHLGIMRYAAAEPEAAAEAWERSLEAAENPWAARNLGLLLWERAGRAGADVSAADTSASELYVQATERYTQALRMAPDILPLAVECGQKLIAMDEHARWLALLEMLPPASRQAGRIRLLEGQAALAVGDLERVALLFDGSLVVDDLREGERSLSELWFDYHAERISRDEQVPIDEALRERVRETCPVPAFLDFRMSN